eukprot:PhM_4_TR4477/c0_g1_i1/m.40740
MFVVFISFDSPMCKDIAVSVKEYLGSELPAGAVTVCLVPVLNSGEIHRDNIAVSMQQFSEISARDVYVLTLLHDNNTEEHRRVVELCASFGSTTLARTVLMCLSSYKDTSLLVKNTVRSIVAKFQQEK